MAKKEQKRLVQDGKTEHIEPKKEHIKDKPWMKENPRHKDLTHRYRFQIDVGYQKKKKQMDPNDKNRFPDPEVEPNLQISVTQLMDTYTKGGSKKVPMWFETEIPQIKDLADVAERREWHKDTLARIEEWEKQQEEEAKKAKKTEPSTPPEPPKKSDETKD